VIFISCLSCHNKQDTSLRLGTNIWPGYEPLYVAKERNVFENINISLLEYRSASQVLNGIRSGHINMAAVTLDEAIRLRDQGFDIEVVWIFDISNGADALISQSDINSIQGLIGKSIAYEKSALGEYIFNRFLAKHNLNFNDYIIHGLEVNYHYQKMKNKTIDAVFTFDPQLSQIKSLGGNILFDSSKIPNEILDVLIINKAKFDKKRYEALNKFIINYATFLDHMFADFNSHLPLLNQRLRLSEKQLISSFKKITIPSISEQIQLFNNKEFLQKVIGQYEAIFIENKIISKKCNCSDLFNSQYLKTLNEN